MPPSSADRLQYGDFQTPDSLAQQACDLLAAQGLAPGSILEPTCGLGSFLFAARARFPAAERVVGVEINPAYAGQAQERAAEGVPGVEVIRADFFAFDWPALIRTLPGPLLILGNPPWVTSAGISSINGANLPEKSNFQNHVGIEAVTGKANFDISEWMLMQMLGWVQDRRATLAMLCKTAVARKVLVHAWKIGLRLRSAEAYAVNAKKHFGAVVDACFLVLNTGVEPGEEPYSQTCRFYQSLEAPGEPLEWGYRDGFLLADVVRYELWKHLAGAGGYRWRSGIKHDCAKVMELTETEDRLRNGLGESVHLEDEYLYPLLKSSDVAGAGRAPRTKKWLLVPQRSTGEDTTSIADQAPRTWAYLTGHAGWLDQRKSTVYRNRPRFSIFGVGAYTFAPWKVVISSMYKTLRFCAVGPRQGKPVVFDDTCSFLPCQNQAEAELLAGLLNSAPAREFLEAFLFWDAKRPVTIEILQRLHLEALARELGVGEQIAAFRARRVLPQSEASSSEK